MNRRGKWTSLRIAAGAAVAWAAPGCDPIVNIAGANFPSWLVAAIVGAILAAIVRPLFVAAGLERYLWPLPAVYASLAVLLGCIFWIIFFNRV
ncbi:MAG TPA: YtcA family lipoprotein [Candidatus Binataceae bacterium]|nr:YtcA family lipoprotein [Candidatus Binataceae bacterium]